MVVITLSSRRKKKKKSLSIPVHQKINLPTIPLNYFTETKKFHIYYGGLININIDTERRSTECSLQRVAEHKGFFAYEACQESQKFPTVL